MGSLIFKTGVDLERVKVPPRGCFLRHRFRSDAPIGTFTMTISTGTMAISDAVGLVFDN